MQEEGLKILSSEVSNFKNISHKLIEFEGRSAMVLGKNGAGKSSLLQALTCAINSNMIPSKPIKEGEENSSVLVKVGGVLDGEYQEYNIDIYFTEKDSRGRLVISDKDGGKIPGGKSMVKSIVGNVGFDILEFIDMGLTKDGRVSIPGVRSQIEVLKQFLPMETQKLLMDLDTEKGTVYDDRSEINKDIKSNEAKMKDAAMDPADIEKYSNPIDTVKVTDAMAKIGEDISLYDRIIEGMKTKGLKETALQNRIGDLEAQIIEIRKDINSCTNELTEISDDIIKGGKWVAKKGERPSMVSLLTEMEEISAHNLINAKVVESKGFHKNIADFTEKSEERTERLKTIELEKKAAFEANPLPVKGLTFSDDEVLYNGLPFNENQHPSSTIIGVGLTVAMAMNPNLRLLVIKDGSLLDQKTLNYILKLVEKKGYQVFIEMVDQSGESNVTVNFIESQAK